ncbi:hypothetical protein ACQKO5_01765 [Novosphingobium subterraneum]|uniref:hypothetical protein n=1 Tax=Novosphingobium subterraneum TaxID=48936 RepID=UPI003D005E8A
MALSIALALLSTATRQTNGTCPVIVIDADPCDACTALLAAIVPNEASAKAAILPEIMMQSPLTLRHHASVPANVGFRFLVNNFRKSFRNGGISAFFLRNLPKSDYLSRSKSLNVPFFPAGTASAIRA